MDLDRDKLLWIYRRMRQIREFENRLHEDFAAGLIPGFVHLYAGEEAIAVGVCAHLADDDFITSTHRGHGHCIAKGVEINGMMAEIRGKAAGCCKGKGGSMHIADLDKGMLGANGIVGGGFGLSTGAGLSAKLRGSDQVAVCFFGDGAANQGIMLETVNMAAVWNLPVIYVCENNQYGEHTPYQSVTGVVDIADRAKGMGLEGIIAHRASLCKNVIFCKNRQNPKLDSEYFYRTTGTHSISVKKKSKILKNPKILSWPDIRKSRYI